MTELRDASLPWLLATWREVHAEHLGLDEMTACVEPPEARDALRHTIEQDYLTIREELARRRQLVEALTGHAGEDGCRLLLRPPG